MTEDQPSIDIGLLQPEQITMIRAPFEDLPIGDYGLATTFLQLPMRLRIGDTELIAHDDDTPYGRPPILGIARWGLAALEKTKTSRRCVYEILMPLPPS